MGSCFVLLTASPGATREVLDRLADVPGIIARQHLFGEQIAIRLDEAQLPDAQRLAALAGVREARVYHDQEAWIVRPAARQAPGTNT